MKVLIIGCTMVLAAGCGSSAGDAGSPSQETKPTPATSAEAQRPTTTRPPSTTTAAVALPFTPQDPAAIRSALKQAGLSICGDVNFPIPNDGYKFDESDDLNLAKAGAPCHKSIEQMEAEPSHGFLSIERFKTQKRRDQGIKVHRTELITGTQRGDYYPAYAVWAYGNYLIVLDSDPTKDVEQAVVVAMTRLPGAKYLFTLKPPSGPHLGDSRDTWDKALKHSKPHAGDLGATFEPCNDDSETFQYSVTFEPVADFISYGSCDGTGPDDLDAAAAQARRYLPADAQPARDTTTDMGEDVRIFTSRALADAARRHPPLAEHTTDCNGDQVAPGTFFLVAEETGWTAGLGTCP
jgi:hypothetical protein